MLAPHGIITDDGIIVHIVPSHPT